jgi:glycosyltransferase involved in cell wall biosynthesis
MILEVTMNLFYLTFINVEEEAYIGVKNKITGQMNTFKKKFSDVFFSSHLLNEIIIKKAESPHETVVQINVLPQSRKTLFSQRSHYMALLDFIMTYSITHLYIRYSLSNPYFLLFLRGCARLGVRVYIEIPTYPYHKESIGKKTLFVDTICSHFLQLYTEAIVTYSHHATIFNIPTIPVKNGIDPSLYPVKTSPFQKKALHLIAVANINHWHGYDRILVGLNKYYGHTPSFPVTLTIVGIGDELENLKSYVKSNHLEPFVFFRGFLIGEALNEVFEMADLGVSVLGLHRKGLTHSSTLKSREYLLRGLPFITSSADDDITAELSPFVLQMNADDSPIDISDIVHRYQALIANTELCSDYLRSIAVKQLSWDHQLRPVLDAMHL